MATNDYILHKMNASGDWEEKVVNAENGKVLGFDSSLNPVMLTPGGSTDVYTFVVTGTTVPTTGLKARVRVRANATPSAWTFVSAQTGSIVLDIKTSSHASYPTTTSIVASDAPTVTTNSKGEDTNLSTWTGLT